MARADLLIELAEAALNSNDARVRSVLAAIAAEEREKKHRILAGELGRLLDQPPNRNLALRPLGAIAQSGGLLEIEPKIRMHDLVLPDVVQSELMMVVEQQHRAELLRAYNLEPRNRVLLVGPPGNGKTSCAEALATELAVPLFTLRYESVITSYLGETSSKLDAVLDEVKRRHCVLFIDEFDTLAKERGDEHDHGEIKRVVSTLLLQIDRLPSHVVVCAATNHSELLDRAVWRRFQVRLDLPSPSKRERQRFARILVERLQLKLPNSVDSLVDKLGVMSYSELEEFFVEFRRRQVLALRENENDEPIVRGLLVALKAQSGHSKRSGFEQSIEPDGLG